MTTSTVDQLTADLMAVYATGHRIAPQLAALAVRHGTRQEDWAAAHLAQRKAEGWNLTFTNVPLPGTISITTELADGRIPTMVMDAIHAHALVEHTWLHGQRHP